MTEDIGKLILRVSVALLMLLHGIHKLLHGVDGVSGMLSGIGLPGALAYFVYLGEVIAPILAILGLYTRVAAVVMAGNMLVALALAHAGELLSLTKMGGWAVELQGLYLFGAISIALLGAGRYSVGGAHGKYN